MWRPSYLPFRNVKVTVRPIYRVNHLLRAVPVAALCERRSIQTVISAVTDRRYKKDLNDLPHPGPLLQGEGETCAASWECGATGLAGCASNQQTTGCGLSSPSGEETGEGGCESRMWSAAKISKRVVLRGDDNFVCYFFLRKRRAILPWPRRWAKSKGERFSNLLRVSIFAPLEINNLTNDS